MNLIFLTLVVVEGATRASKPPKTTTPSARSGEAPAQCDSGVMVGYDQSGGGGYNGLDNVSVAECCDACTYAS